MKKDNIIHKSVIVYYALTCIFFFYRIQSFAKDIFIAPLYFITPVGVGLFILSMIGFKKIIDAGATRLQIVLLSAFLGITIITLRYVELTIKGQPQHVDLVYFIFCIMSVVGYIRANAILTFDKHAKSLLKTMFLVSPVWIVSYYFFYWHFSPFPFRDLVMETHFMKGAEEFARHGFINIATGDTYMPVLQVGWGLLKRVHSFDLMHGQWILPAYLSIFTLLCIYSFLESFIKDRAILVLSMVGIIASENQSFAIVNNTYITALSFLFISLLVCFYKNEQKGILRILFELILMIALSIIFFKIRLVPSFTASIWPYLIIFIITAIIFIRLGFDGLTGQAILVLALIIAPQFHRASSLNMPLMVMLYGIYHIIYKTRLAGDADSRQKLIFKIFTYPFILIPISLGISFIIIEYRPGVYQIIIKMVDAIGMAMVGENSTINEGLNAAVADWLRRTPPMMHVLFAALAAYVLVRYRGKMSESYLNVILFATISLGAMMILYISPLPRVHRLLPFPSIMFVVITSVFLKMHIEDVNSGLRQRVLRLIVPVLVILLISIGMFYLYRMPWKPGDASDYVRALWPLTGILAIFMITAFFLLIFSRRGIMISALFIIAVFSGILLDKYQFISKLYFNAYGMRLGNNNIISHYSPLVLSIAEELGMKGFRSQTLLLSDPITLSIFEARTGINGYYTFENLGEPMLPVYNKNIKAILCEAFPQDDAAKAFDKDKPRRIIEMLDDFAQRHKGVMPEARYALHKLTGIPRDYGAGGDELGWNEIDYKSNVIWILNEKTVRWAWSAENVSKFPNGDVGYYPMNATFSDEYLKDYIFPYFEVLHNSLNKVLVLKLK